LVHSSVQHSPDTVEGLRAVEATAILVNTTYGKIKIISVYHPPKNRLYACDLDKLLPPNHKVIVAGDLNAKHESWHSSVMNIRGQDLYNHAALHDYVVIGPCEPTFYNHNMSHQADVLDVAILADIRADYDITVVDALVSDHNPIILTVGHCINRTTPRQVKAYERANWESFRSTVFAQLPTEPPVIQDAAALDDAVSTLTRAIQTGIDNAIPTVTLTDNSYLDIPTRIRRSIDCKNVIKRQYQRTRDPMLKTQLNRAVRQIHQDIATLRAERWEHKLAKLRLHDNSLWRMTRALRSTVRVDSPLDTPNGVALSAREKAEVIADTLEEAFTPNPPADDSEDIEDDVMQFLWTPEQQTPPDLLKCSSLSELATIAGTLSNNKAPGLDGITVREFKALPTRAAEYYLHIVNASINLAYFPDQWKTAKIVSFPKPGKPLKSPTSYRPISLLSVLSKIFERVILKRIQYHIDDVEPLPLEQFGFRDAHSAPQQVSRVVQIITRNRDLYNCSTAGVFLDVAKAFDKVWHTGLLYKLKQLGFPEYLVRLSASYLQGRQFTAAWGADTSTLRSIAAGVPQGSCLGPVFYNIYTHDIPRPPEMIELAGYADDLAILIRGLSNCMLVLRAQPYLDRLTEYYARWRTNLNVSKTVAVLFRSKRVEMPDLHLNHSRIIWKNRADYLGTVLDKMVSFRLNTTARVAKAAAAHAQLYPLLKSSSIKRETRLLIYKVIIWPTLTYAAPAWIHMASSSVQRLQVIQNKSLRAIAGAPPRTRTRDLHDFLDIPYVEDHLIRIADKFFDTAKTSGNPLIRSLEPNRLARRVLKRRRPRDSGTYSQNPPHHTFDSARQWDPDIEPPDKRPRLI
jgi:Reverse transcriptase (RNA-dependent DNA polymerase)/Endonuclease-reverse transcriptase